MTTIKRNFIQDYKTGLQYITLSRGVSNSEVPEELAQYRPFKGSGIRVNALVRFDDDCRNGHCTLTISGNVSVGREEIAGGQIPDLLSFVFPELRPFFKWHLVSTNGPMHYTANTVYLAGDRDSSGRKAGEPESFVHGLRFNGIPITHRIQSRKFWEFLRDNMKQGADGTYGTYTAGAFETFAIAHENRKGDTYKFDPKYSIVGYEGANKWHECPFDDKMEAEEFTEALNTCSVEFVKIPTAWSKGKERELDAARQTAVWPDATDEELSVEPDELKKKLEERLPGLLAEFRIAVESLGFDYNFPAKGRAQQAS